MRGELFNPLLTFDLTFQHCRNVFRTGLQNPSRSRFTALLTAPIPRPAQVPYLSRIIFHFLGFEMIYDSP